MEWKMENGKWKMENGKWKWNGNGTVTNNTITHLALIVAPACELALSDTGAGDGRVEEALNLGFARQAQLRRPGELYCQSNI